MAAAESATRLEALMTLSAAHRQPRSFTGRSGFLRVSAAHRFVGAFPPGATAALNLERSTLARAG